MALPEQLPECANARKSVGIFARFSGRLRDSLAKLFTGKQQQEPAPEIPPTIVRNIDGYIVTLSRVGFSKPIPGLSDGEIATFWVEKVERDGPDGREELSVFAAFKNQIVLALPRDILSESARDQKWSSDPVDILAYSTLQEPADQEIAQMIRDLKNGEVKLLSTIEVPAYETIFEQGKSTTAAMALVRGTVEILGNIAGGGTTHIRTVNHPTILGEISTIRGGPATATVRTMTPCTFIRIPKDTLIQLANREDWKPYFERLIDQRLVQHTLAVQEYEERIERVRAERDATGFPLNNTLAAALDLPSAALELDQMVGSKNREPIVRRSVTLLGTHRTTGEMQSVEFHIAMMRKRTSDIDVHISLDPHAIPGDVLRSPSITCSVDSDLQKAYLAEGCLHELKGYGFYSQILPVMLRNVPITDSHIVNIETKNFLASQTDGEIVPSTVLALHSPVVAARKHGLSIMRGTYGKPQHRSNTEPLKTYKVPANWQAILILATELERLLSVDESTYTAARAALEKKYQETLARIAQMVRQHAENEADSLVSLYDDAEFQEAAALQIERLMELTEGIGQREAALLE